MRTLWYILSHFGICFMEVYILVWIYAFGRAYLGDVLYGMLLLGITVVTLLLVFNRARQLGRAGRGFVRAVIGAIFSLFITLILAWYYLVVGILNGRVATATDQHLPLGLVLRPHRGIIRVRTLQFRRMTENELPLHFTLGRWIYRTFNSLLSRIPFLGSHPTLTATLARVVGLIIALWGIWDLPAFLMG